MLTKEDYMKMPKAKLAELLVEKDRMINSLIPNSAPNKGNTVIEKI